MTTSTVEQLDPKVLEPIFANIEPVRKDINIIRGLVASIGQERYVRLRQVIPIERVGFPGGATTPSKDREIYFVDGLRPRGDERSLQFITAVWDRTHDGLNLYESGGYMRHFAAGELKELGKTALELFKRYDELTVSHRISEGRLRGWFDPDIHTAEGMVELAAILNGQSEVVDDQKD